MGRAIYIVCVILFLCHGGVSEQCFTSLPTVRVQTPPI